MRVRAFVYIQGLMQSDWLYEAFHILDFWIWDPHTIKMMCPHVLPRVGAMSHIHRSNTHCQLEENVIKVYNLTKTVSPILWDCLSWIHPIHEMPNMKNFLNWLKVSFQSQWIQWDSTCIVWSHLASCLNQMVDIVPDKVKCRSDYQVMDWGLMDGFELHLMDPCCMFFIIEINHIFMIVRSSDDDRGVA